eukprot:jgi/Bigna1/89092/estExt_fgenesh1_pg.C_430093
MIGDNNETEDSKSVEEGAADRRESTRKRQQTAIFDPNAWQIEADIRKNRPENPPVSSSSDMATSSPHKKRLRRINNVLDDGQKEKAEKQGREKEKQIDIGDTSDYDENIEFDRAHLLLGIPSFGSSSTKKVALPQTSTEKEPRFVNSRQYRRIIQRRKWRESNATDLIKHAKERERVEHTILITRSEARSISHEEPTRTTREGGGKACCCCCCEDGGGFSSGRRFKDRRFEWQLLSA